MYRRLCPYRAGLLPGGLLFLLLLLMLLADPALPTGRHPPVVLGEHASGGGLFRWSVPQLGAGWAAFPVCICSKHGMRERLTVLSPGWAVHLSACWAGMWLASHHLPP